MNKIINISIRQSDKPILVTLIYRISSMQIELRKYHYNTSKKKAVGCELCNLYTVKDCKKLKKHTSGKNYFFPIVCLLLFLYLVSVLLMFI